MNMATNHRPANARRLTNTAELVQLDNVPTGEDEVILPDFEAEVDGARVWVTAVLERTVVVEPAPGEPKVLVNRKRCMVDPTHIRVQHLAGREAARRGREAARQLRLQEQNPAA